MPLMMSEMAIFHQRPICRLSGGVMHGATKPGDLVDQQINKLSGGQGAILKTVPKPEAPPPNVVPYRLPAASRTKPAKG
jgi:hypothetical protein